MLMIGHSASGISFNQTEALLRSKLCLSPSVSNFCARFSKRHVMKGQIKWWRREVSAVFSGYDDLCLLFSVLVQNIVLLVPE